MNIEIIHSCFKCFCRFRTIFRPCHGTFRGLFRIATPNRSEKHWWTKGTTFKSPVVTPSTAAVTPRRIRESRCSAFGFANLCILSRYPMCRSEGPRPQLVTLWNWKSIKCDTAEYVRPSRSSSSVTVFAAYTHVLSRADPSRVAGVRQYSQHEQDA